MSVVEDDELPLRAQFRLRRLGHRRLTLILQIAMYQRQYRVMLRDIDDLVPVADAGCQSRCLRRALSGRSRRRAAQHQRSFEGQVGWIEKSVGCHGVINSSLRERPSQARSTVFQLPDLRPEIASVEVTNCRYSRQFGPFNIP